MPTSTIVVAPVTTTGSTSATGRPSTTLHTRTSSSTATVSATATQSQAPLFTSGAEAGARAGASALGLIAAAAGLVLML